MFLITIKVEDTDSKLTMFNENIVVQPGFNQTSTTFDIPYINSDGLILYRYDFITQAYKDDFPKPELEEIK